MQTENIVHCTENHASDEETKNDVTKICNEPGIIEQNIAGLNSLPAMLELPQQKPGGLQATPCQYVVGKERQKRGHLTYILALF